MGDSTKDKFRSGRSSYPTDWDFRPYIGRLGARAQREVGSFSRVLKRALGSKFFLGVASRGSLQGQRGAYRRTPSAFLQRVVVKARVVRHVAAGGRRSLRAHVVYLQREGVGKYGEEARIFTRDGQAKKEQTLEICGDWSKDRHHFRFIVSPEKGSEVDLDGFARELIRKMEKDLGTDLQYLFVCHYNTETPHVHLVIRGKTDQGKDLVISRDYISRGIRYAASEILTQELGPRSKIDIENSLWQEVERERLVSIDKELIKQSARHVLGEVHLTEKKVPDVRELFWKKQRMQFLLERGLARRIKQLSFCKSSSFRSWAPVEIVFSC